MTVVTLLKIVKDVVVVLEEQNVIQEDGSVRKLSVVEWADLVNSLEPVFAAHGIHEPSELNQLTDALPGILRLLGI